MTKQNIFAHGRDDCDKGRSSYSVNKLLKITSGIPSNKVKTSNANETFIWRLSRKQAISDSDYFADVGGRKMHGTEL